MGFSCRPPDGKRLTGFRQRGFGVFGLLGLLSFRWRVLGGRKDQGDGALNHFQALSEECGVAVVQVDVVGGYASGVKADGLAHNEGDGLGLCLPYRLGGGGPALGFVEHLVRSS